MERSRLDGTLCGTRGTDCAVVSLGLAAASERKVDIGLDRLLENVCESSDVAVVNSFFLAEGVSTNVLVSSRIHSRKVPTDSPQVG